MKNQNKKSYINISDLSKMLVTQLAIITPITPTKKISAPTADLVVGRR